MPNFKKNRNPILMAGTKGGPIHSNYSPLKQGEEEETKSLDEWGQEEYGYLPWEEGYTESKAVEYDDKGEAKRKKRGTKLSRWFHEKIYKGKRSKRDVEVPEKTWEKTMNPIEQRDPSALGKPAKKKPGYTPL